MKDLLAVVAPTFESRLGSNVDYGIQLARLLGAHFTALIADVEIASPRREVALDSHDRAEPDGPGYVSSDVAATEALIRAAAAQHDVSCCVLSHGNVSLRESLIENAQIRDVVLLEVFESVRYPRKGLVEAVLFNTGRPIVLVPASHEYNALRAAVIAWDGTPASVRALHDALPLLADVDEIVVLTVTGDKDFRLFRSGKDVCRHLARWNIAARAETVEQGQRTVGTTLLNYAREIKAGLLIMGGFGHAKEMEFVFGSATQDILQSRLDVPVLLSH